MLTSNQFSVLYCYKKVPNPSQRQIAKMTGLSASTVSTTEAQLSELSYLDPAVGLTIDGNSALKPYHVDNAVIMAAGLSSRFAPISYERPKGVLEVAGEVLIERQIRQLQEAGISDISVVVGYKKEEFFYLEDELNVKIVINNEFRERNNNSSIKAAERLLGNTYICSSDDWFAKNPFDEYVYDSYCAATYIDGPTKEWCVRTKGKHEQIVGIDVGGHDAWAIRGHSYWSSEFSNAYVKLLDEIYDEPATAQKLWGQIFIDHMSKLPPMHIRRYDTDKIWEFKSINELRLFDPNFIDNVDSIILDNICTVLECERQNIKNVIPIKKGMTNMSFKFEVDGTEYVYRHPGIGSEEITNRHSETFSQQVAKKLGIDTTFIYENPEQGWKISRFISNTVPFDYHNEDHVREAMRMANKLHSCGEASEFFFDIHQDTLKQIDLIDDSHRTSFKDFSTLFQAVEKLNLAVTAQGVEPVLSHNDFYDQNFLVSKDRMDLIDWEYSGMSDYASDIAVFICCCPDYTYEDSIKIFELYFGRPMTDEELFHCVAYSAVVSFHWFVWALYKDVTGEPVGEFLYYYYRYTKMFISKALEIKEGEIK